MTGCECAGPGYCKRHQCVKGTHWHLLCQTRIDYFSAWEAGIGPGQQRTGKSLGLGDTVARLTHALGIPHCCGCEKRRQWLNRIWPYARAKQ